MSDAPSSPSNATEETSFHTSADAAAAWSVNNKAIANLNAQLKEERKKKKLLEQTLTKLMVQEGIDTISAGGSRLALHKKLTASKLTDP